MVIKRCWRRSALVRLGLESKADPAHAALPLRRLAFLIDQLHLIAKAVDALRHMPRQEVAPIRSPHQLIHVDGRDINHHRTTMSQSIS